MTIRAAAEDCLAGLAKDPALHEGASRDGGRAVGRTRDLHGALWWYDRLAARLRPEQIDALHVEGAARHGWCRPAAGSEVRRKLKLRRTR